MKKKLMLFLLVLAAESAYPNAANLQKIPSMVNRIVKHPEAIANFNNIIHILGRASKAELTAYLLEGGWRYEIDDPVIVRRIERVVSMKISDRTDGDILEYVAGWQDVEKTRIPELKPQVVEEILREGDSDEINLLLYVVRYDPTLISENQIIELIDRGLEDNLILIDIISYIGKSEYWAKRAKWMDHFFAVVDDYRITEALRIAVSDGDTG